MANVPQNERIITFAVIPGRLQEIRAEHRAERDARLGRVLQTFARIHMGISQHAPMDRALSYAPVGKAIDATVAAKRSGDLFVLSMFPDTPGILWVHPGGLSGYRELSPEDAQNKMEAGGAWVAFFPGTFSSFESLPEGFSPQFAYGFRSDDDVRRVLRTELPIPVNMRRIEQGTHGGEEAIQIAERFGRFLLPDSGMSGVRISEIPTESESQS